MKYFKLVLIAILVIGLFILSGCNNGDSFFDPWDNLGGGKEGIDISDYSDETAGAYLLDSVKNDTSSSDGSYDESASNCYTINLDNIKTADLSNITAYSYKDDEIKIKASGVFVLSGEFLGTITINDTEDIIQLVLNGVSIATTDSQDTAAIVFKKPEGDTISERILTIKENTTNIISDSIGDTADGDGAVIQAKKRSLSINGTGKLMLNCVGEETSGLKVKTELTINGPTISISGSNKSGIKADQLIIVKNANIAINSNGDGLKTDMEPESTEEAQLYASDSKYGYIYIENSNLDITAGDDGISANNCLYIANTTANTIKVTTNGGAPTTITESSSDNADGKAIKTDGIEFDDVSYPASYSQNYGLIIMGGNFEINSNDDAISSKGNLLIENGVFDITTGDDGIHAEYLTKIKGGAITIYRSYEGVEGATVEILGGTLNITSTDDGINAANSDLGNYSFYILIAGGDLIVNAGGDGVDSNGTIKITGGKLYIYGPTNSANASLDSETGVIIKGGTMCAVGAAGMVENPSNNSTQCYISLTLSSTQSANTQVTVKDADGNIIFESTPIKKYQSVIITTEAFVKEETYTIIVGTESYSATLSSIGTALGRNMHGDGNQGFMPGGPRR